jgi:hypothetical protein
VTAKRPIVKKMVFNTERERIDKCLYVNNILSIPFQNELCGVGVENCDQRQFVIET